MIKNSICLILVLIAHFCNAQNNKKYELQKNYFLLGTLSDYMGRYKDPLVIDVVDTYYVNEKLLLIYNYNTFKSEFSDLKLDTINRTLKSIALTEKMNTFFNWNYDENFTNENSDSLFIGNINLKKIKSIKQKISFVVGVYTRYGQKNDSTYCINIANSNTLFDSSLKILRDLNCKNIKSEIYQAIPTSCIIYFQPSEELKKYLIYYSFLRETIWDTKKT